MKGTLWFTLVLLFAVTIFHASTSAQENKNDTHQATGPSKPRPGPCGKQLKRVRNGENATLGTWPWMVGVYKLSWFSGENILNCGGTLIDREWVLTAAHCIPATPTNGLIRVRLGDLDVNSTADGANPIDVAVNMTIMHPDYHKIDGVPQNDIGLIRLPEPVNYTQHISPICIRGGIYANESTYLKMEPTVIGWGMRFLGDIKRPTQLQQAQLNVVSFKDCNPRFENKLHKNLSLCAIAPGKDACQGDSGGPLMFPETDGAYSLGGIVSYGTGCDGSDAPTLYTKVAGYIGWINNQTGLNFQAADSA